MKHYLSACILSAVVAFPAAAESTVYGQIVSGVSVSQTRTADGRSTSSSQIGDYGSYIGLRGSIPLGGRVNTVWQLESSSPPSDGGSLRERARRKKESGFSVGIGSTEIRR